MNTEDKEILELLRKDRAIKAPEDFTINVMNSIIELEENKKPAFQFNTLVISLFMLTTIVVSIVVFYLFDNTLFENFFSLITFFSEIFNNQFAWFNNYLLQISSLLKQNAFALGIAFSLLALLSFDRLIFKRKLRINMLSII